MDARTEIRATLERTRAATEALLEPLSDEALAEQSSPVVPPPAWDLARVAHFEELWLLRTLLGHEPVAREHAEIYDAFRRERRNGDDLPALRAPAARAYAADVRERVLHAVEQMDLDAPNALLRDGYVFGLVVQHELQHQETILESLQARTEHEYPVPTPPEHDRAPGGSDELEVPAGSFVLGAVEEPWAYDNELVPHEVEVRGFRIDRAPVTNGAFAEFVEDGGYGAKRLWSAAGWEWRERAHARAPLYWQRSGRDWERVRFGRREPLPEDEPVQHVSFHEAEAYARWAGRRLPSEVEWERAAGWDERRGKLRYPWGREWVGFEATLGRRRFSPAPAGSYSGGMSPIGCVQMAGDVWEWTSSYFQAYPGFLAFPYPEHSEVYFGEEYRVLRGGSWATDALVARVSFRNWSAPDRRLLFAGFRCARDAG